MVETLFIFDDWAMHLMKTWLATHHKYNAANDDYRRRGKLPSTLYNLTISKAAADQAYSDLINHLFSLLEYDVPRHRHGYSSYIILSEDCVETLKRYRSKTTASRSKSFEQYMIEADIERTLKESLAREGSLFF